MKEWDYMQTCTGKKFFLDDPVFDDEDIFMALAKQGRYGGHTKGFIFYSVAEHSTLVADWLMTKGEGSANDRGWLAWNGLMHDCTEGYIQDVVRPLKNKLSDYKPLEADLYRKMAAHYGLSPRYIPEVMEADNRILMDEKLAVMEPGVDWGFPPDMRALGVNIQCLKSEDAYRAFKDAFSNYKVFARV